MLDAMHWRAGISVALLCFALTPASAERTLADYKYFRRLSIDLVGRPPSRAEIAELERPGFSTERWIDQHLDGAAYAERLRRVYMDLLRLEVGPQYPFAPSSLALHRVEVRGPDGAPLYIYFRRGQRRVPVEIDGDFCFTSDESGIKVVPGGGTTGVPKRLSQSLLDRRTELVKPWWLYADYRATQPRDRLDPGWATRFPGYELIPEMQYEPDGKTPVVAVRVCKEEAQTAETGRVYTSGRTNPPQGTPLPRYRATHPPADSYFAKVSQGKTVSCLTWTGFENSVDCGCGTGLERCTPNIDNRYESVAFILPSPAPLGPASPFGKASVPASGWLRYWWGEEARQFLGWIFQSDRDFREVLTSRSSVVNGPLAHFYRFFASTTCCGSATQLGYVFPEPLVNPAAMPSDLPPMDTSTWRAVPDRGPHAAGLLTMPAFLAKYGSRRARAHAVYNAFLCKTFTAPEAQLTASEEPDLTKRPGCSACHKTLEPMAAYFARINEADWMYWPAAYVPRSIPECKSRKAAYCNKIYDVALGGTLKGAHTALQHADDGPAGFAREITSSPEFASCVVKNIAESFLGRALTPDDESWKGELTRTFVSSGYRTRPLVRHIVTSNQYRLGNDAR